MPRKTWVVKMGMVKFGQENREKNRDSKFSGVWCWKTGACRRAPVTYANHRFSRVQIWVTHGVWEIQQLIPATRGTMNLLRDPIVLTCIA